MTGVRRPDGRFGIRNHVLVLPSVVCSTHVAGEIAGDGPAIAIVHQHGCLHVGDDLRHTEGVLVGTATNPNVGAVVVVSLGCETIQGKRLARRIEEAGQRVAFVGIQHAGGTERALAEGRAAVERLLDELDRDPREPVAAGDVVVGIDAAGMLADALRERLEADGTRVLMAGGLDGAEAHVSLASAGAQLIVSLRGPGQAPTGFATCPVIAVGLDGELLAALRDDFDVGAIEGEPTEALIERIHAQVEAVCAGASTASEERGARDFVLRRLAMTM